ncbi:MAG TPA: RNA polymerase sigma factor [Hellea balneolensis]|uniref:RNA polymerase sigma factor n=1 Tax=Hellea balneolensis TaxID=287478 RepID=A0A7V5NWP1_9PROT|nr:RNA polymerase sigma factor [Hellea balneolensis]
MKRLGNMSTQQREILTALYVEQRTALLRFLNARVRNPELAEDILQDMYLKLARTNLPEDIGNPSGFLFRMAANLSLDHIRKTKRARLRDQAWVDTYSQKSGAEYVADEPDADSIITGKQKLAALKKRLESLSPKAREAFIRHKFDGQSYQQVAEEMGISIGTVGKHLGKALKHIMDFRPTGDEYDG